MGRVIIRTLKAAGHAHAVPHSTGCSECRLINRTHAECKAAARETCPRPAPSRPTCRRGSCHNETDTGKVLSRKNRRRQAAARLARRHHHQHLPTLKLRHLLHLGKVIEFLADTIKHFHAEVLMRHFTAAEADGDLDLVALLDEPTHVAHLDLIVVVIDIRTHFYFFNLDDPLLFSRLAFFLLFSVLELAEVENLADGRIGRRGHFNEVQPGLFRDREGILNRQNSELFAFWIDNADPCCVDLAVYPWPLPNRRRWRCYSCYGCCSFIKVKAIGGCQQPTAVPIQRVTGG